MSSVSGKSFGGMDVLVAASEEGLKRSVVNTAVIPYLDEIDNDDAAGRIERAIEAGDNDAALAAWGEAQASGREEWVELDSVRLGE